MKKIFWTITCVLFVAAALSACTSDEFPTGTYTHSSRVVEYRDDGTFTYLWDDEVITEGTYVIQDDEIQFTDSYCAEEFANPGTYKWQYEDDKLTLELIEDLCEGRRELNTLTWFGPK